MTRISGWYDGSAYNGRHAWVVFSYRQVSRRGCSHPHLLSPFARLVDQLCVYVWRNGWAWVCPVAVATARSGGAGSSARYCRRMVRPGTPLHTLTSHRRSLELRQHRGYRTRSHAGDAEAHGRDRPHREYWVWSFAGSDGDDDRAADQSLRAALDDTDPSVARRRLGKPAAGCREPAARIAAR